MTFPTARLGRILLSAALASVPMAAYATEGGSGAYLLGTRDSLVGIAPPTGTYLSVDENYISGTAPFISLGGKVLSNAEINVWVTRVNFTHSFGPVAGGRFAVTITQPFVTGSLKFAGTLFTGFSGQVQDNSTGLGDTVITPTLGWDSGTSHFSVQTSLYVPLGYYEPTSVNLKTRSIQALSFSKNRIAVQPVINFTSMNPKSGLEFNASTSITFSARNAATDYKTAPEWQVELSAYQHLKNGLAFGLAGYGYQQLGNDSGSGAAQLQAAYGAKTLEARIFGAGPVLTYGTKVGDHSLSFKFKYTKEFGARRRVESDIGQMSIGWSF